jgi:branched-chain amino acid transport system ATP-binding protein
MESWRPAENGPLLEVTTLSKAFAGIIASDRLSFDVDAGELHAVIGPNGAGKTTLVNQIGGQTLPDSGSIKFAGFDITWLPAHRRSKLGLARSFQISELFLDFTTIDNVALAVQAQVGHSFRFWRAARSEVELRRPAIDALARVGLLDRADFPASHLSHGEHRLLELAVALGGQPQMLILDEPMAGLGPEESTRMIALLRQLKEEFTILLIEHDMDAVFALADRITVLLSGRVVATDVPTAIRTNAEVQEAYLGSQNPMANLA